MANIHAQKDIHCYFCRSFMWRATAGDGEAAGRAGAHSRNMPGLLAAGVLQFFLQGCSMAKMVIFSAVQGRVLDNGKPVAGAVVEREFRWAWKEENGTDSATTGLDGSFTLPAIERGSSLGSLLPHEPMVRQTILSQHAGKTYKAWMFDKGNDKDNGELGGKRIHITCRLKNQPSRHGEVFGICGIDSGARR